MNFNASRNVGPGSGPRKAKWVNDVASMGAPSPINPTSPFNAGFPAPGPQPLHPDAIHMDASQDFGSPSGPNYYMNSFAQSSVGSPAQIGSMLKQPIVQDMALEYGNQLAAQGRAAVSRYVPVTRLRYYFAVDTRYVLRKLMLIIFPFTHQDWMVKYDQESPVQPRYDINAHDLYIPTMGYVTYVLLAGFLLGLEKRFSPEQISIQASSALAYIIFEVCIYMGTLYVSGASSSLRSLDLLSCCGYKYCAMVFSLCVAMLGSTPYYCALVYTSLALSYFLVKSLKVQVLSGPQPVDQQAYGYGPNYGSPSPYGDNWSKPPGLSGRKRRLYFLLFVALTQPLLSWWLTHHLVPSVPLQTKTT